MIALALSRIEFQEKSSILLLALGVGCLGLLVPWLPGVKSIQSIDLRPSLLIASSLGLGFLLSGILGAASLGQPKASSFFLSRPLSCLEILGGKVLSAWGLSLAAAGCAALPQLIAFAWLQGEISSLWKLFGDSGWTLASMPLLFLASLLAAHLIRISLSARRLWILLDLLSLAFILFGSYRLYILLGVVNLTIPSRNAVLLAYLTGFCGILGLSAWLALSFGRTCLRRSHAALSLSLCSGFLTLGLLGWGAIDFIITPPYWSHSHFKEIGARTSMGWHLLAWVSPTAGHRILSYETWLLHHELSGQIIPVYYSDLQFSGDGRKAVWLEKPSPWRADTREILLAHLDQQPAQILRTGLFLDHEQAVLTSFLLSEEGKRLACLDWERLRVYEVPSGKLLYTESRESDSWSRKIRLHFHGSDDLRVYEASPLTQSLEIREIDLARSRSQRRSVSIPWSVSRQDFQILPEKERLLIGRTQAVQGGPCLWDLRKGQTLPMEAPPQDALMDRASFLGEDSLARVCVLRDHLQIDHFNLEGELIQKHTVSLPWPVDSRAMLRLFLEQKHLLIGLNQEKRFFPIRWDPKSNTSRVSEEQSPMTYRYLWTHWLDPKNPLDPYSETPLYRRQGWALKLVKE